MYLGEIHIRVVSERVWRNVQDNAKKQELTIRSRECFDEHVPSMPEVEASCQLEHYRKKSTNWPFSYLAAGTRDLVKLRVQAASHLCFEKPDSSYSIFTPL